MGRRLRMHTAIRRLSLNTLSQQTSRLWRTIASSAAPGTTLESMTARCAAPTNTLFGPARADGDTATAASSTSYARRPSTMLRRSTQLTYTLPRLAASVCMAVSSAAPDTTLESMTARCAVPTNTLFGPARADGDTATAASSTSYTRRPSTMLRRSTQLTCTLPRLAASVCMAVSSVAPDTTLESMTARCAVPTNTRFGPARADGDTATAASSTSYTRRPSTMLRRSTQLTCTLP